LLAGAGVLAAGSPYAGGVEVCRFQDPRITESSGLASSSRSGDYFFTLNDSGNPAEVYAVDRSGRTLARVRVTGAANLDWEDLARGTDEEGRPALFIADTGDNTAKRASIFLYRIPEPEIDPARPGQTVDSPPAVKYELEYPDGAHDAEALLVQPRTNKTWIITKSLRGSEVYVVPPPMRADAPNRLQKIGSINWALLPATTKRLRDQFSRLLATGGSISPDGSRFVVRTYTDAYEWETPDGSVQHALTRQPVQVPLPATEQGEAITYTADGQALLTSSEGRSAPVHELRRR
ncbi:MAG TPA: hypothetical protein VFU47_05045, partial [Armatimonadota bacterium]|nr:hypothetical protein [Armatimonadota bacterium]